MLPSGDAAVCSGRVSCAAAGTVAATSNGRAANRLRINFSFEFQPEGTARRQVRRIGAVQCNDRLRVGAMRRDIARRATDIEEAADMLAARDALQTEQIGKESCGERVWHDV